MEVYYAEFRKNLDPITSDYFVWYATTPTDIPIYHYHNAYEIFFFIKGHVHVCVEESRFDLTPGNILLIQPWENHRVESYGGTYYERFAVNVSYNILDKLSTPKTNLTDRLFNRPFGRPNIIATNEEELNNYLKLCIIFIKNTKATNMVKISCAVLILLRHLY